MRPYVPGSSRFTLTMPWVDHVLNSDSRLRDVCAGDRNALVAEFRKLDKRLIQADVAPVAVCRATDDTDSRRKSSVTRCGCTTGSASVFGTSRTSSPSAASKSPTRRSANGAGRSGWSGVGARMRAGLRASNRRARHLPMRYETGLPSSVIRFRTLHASTASRRCPDELRARRQSPTIDLYRKNAFSTRAC